MGTGLLNLKVEATFALYVWVLPTEGQFRWLCRV